MFGKVVKKTVSGQVIDQIKALLANGGLRPGSQLPPERQLAEQLGMSRPSLREALRALEFAGVLETRMGEGVFVTDGSGILSNNLQLSHLVQQYELTEMIEVRKVIESATIRFAVARASDEDVEAVRKVHEGSKKQMNNKAEFILSDYAFHRAIAEAGGNGLLVTMLQSMRQMMSEFNAELLLTVKGRKEVVEHHEEILRALEERELEKACGALMRHLDNVVSSREAHAPRLPKKPAATAGKRPGGRPGKKSAAD